MTGRILRASLVMLLLACTTGGSAFAQKIYTCRDAGGHMLTSDRPIPECADRAMKEMSPHGLVIREIAPPSTPEQVKQHELDVQKQKDEELAQREQRRLDAAMLAAYSSVDSIEAARKRSLADPMDAIKASSLHIAELQNDEKSAKVEIAGLGKKPIPVALSHRVDDDDSAIQGEQKEIAARRQEIDRVNQKYDATVQRFKTISAK